MKRLLPIFLMMACCLSVALASSSIPRRDYWGALAYSKSTGRNGFSYNYATQADAINAAVNNCKVRDCQAVVWFVNSCGAFAKGDGTYGWGIGENRDIAESKALAECRKHGGGCHIVEWACTSR